MRLLERSEWPAWAVRDFADSIGRVVVGVGEPETPGVWFVLQAQLFNVKLSRVTDTSIVNWTAETWCYGGLFEALPAFIKWSGEGDPDDRWIRHVAGGRIFRRHWTTGEVFEDLGEEWPDTPSSSAT